MNKFRKALKEDVKLVAIYTTFLMFFFSAFTVFRILTNDKADFTAYDFTYNFIESLVLSKVLLLGQHFHLGERYQDRSLIVPTLYKTLLFSVLVLVFSVAEEFIKGYLHHKSVNIMINNFVEEGAYRALGKVLLMSFAFLFFFAIIELSRVLGERKLFRLFFKRDILDHL